MGLDSQQKHLSASPIEFIAEALPPETLIQYTCGSGDGEVGWCIIIFGKVIQLCILRGGPLMDHSRESKSHLAPIMD